MKMRRIISTAKPIALAALTMFVAACQGVNNNPAAVYTSLEDLQHHRWVLRDIDGLDLQAYAASLGFDPADPPRKTPQLDFGEHGHVSGNTGCNQIQGKARVEDNWLTLSQLASTRMFCPGFAGELELKLSMLYAGPLAISREGETLILKSGDTTLKYRN